MGATHETEVLLVYDRQCPACEFYCRHAEIDAAHGMLRRIDAREASEVRDRITRAGLDIDQGMVLATNGHLYYGADAIHELARRAPVRGAFHRLSRTLFGSAARARLLYPVLRACRNVLLKVLGKTKINNLGLPHNDRF
ncbi:MAG: DCC1-like thiol-disulfide oxidoreductase family protein [Gammaproteobacteria bacterium]